MTACKFACGCACQDEQFCLHLHKSSEDALTRWGCEGIEIMCKVVHEGLHSVCTDTPHRSNVQELTHSGGAFLTVRALSC